MAWATMHWTLFTEVSACRTFRTMHMMEGVKERVCVCVRVWEHTTWSMNLGSNVMRIIMLHIDMSLH